MPASSEQSIPQGITWEDVGAAVIDFVAEQGNFGAAVIDCVAFLKKAHVQKGERMTAMLLGYNGKAALPREALRAFLPLTPRVVVPMHDRENGYRLAR